MLASGSSEGTVKVINDIVVIDLLCHLVVCIIQVWKKDGTQISLRYEFNAKASCLSLSWYPCSEANTSCAVMDASKNHLIAWYVIRNLTI